jgi:hypothetical protein
MGGQFPRTLPWAFVVCTFGAWEGRILNFEKIRSIRFIGRFFDFWGGMPDLRFTPQRVRSPTGRR